MTTSTEERALSLLGQGIDPEQTALALGVSTSMISQLLSDAVFSEKVFELRFKNLAKHNERDLNYDDLEDKLLKKLKDCLPFMLKPMEILKSIQVINAAKRRGASAPESLVNQATVVPLIMPVQIINQYQLNSNNQVVRAGQQELITVQSGHMNKLLENFKGKQNVQPLPQLEQSPATSS